MGIIKNYKNKMESIKNIMDMNKFSEIKQKFTVDANFYLKNIENASDYVMKRAQEKKLGAISNCLQKELTTVKDLESLVGAMEEEKLEEIGAFAYLSNKEFLESVSACGKK